MFPSLWLNRFISSDDEKDQVDTAYAGQHVFDEPFMAGYVYKSEAQIFGGFEMRKSQVNRDSTLLFLLQAVGVNAG